MVHDLVWICQNICVRCVEFWRKCYGTLKTAKVSATSSVINFFVHKISQNNRTATNNFSMLWIKFLYYCWNRRWQIFFSFSSGKVFRWKKNLLNVSRKLKKMRRFCFARLKDGIGRLSYCGLNWHANHTWAPCFGQFIIFMQPYITIYDLGCTSCFFMVVNPGFQEGGKMFTWPLIEFWVYFSHQMN